MEATNKEEIYTNQKQINIEKLEFTNFLIDSHLHFQYFTDEEIKAIIEQCYKASDIKYFLTNSTCKEDFERTINISKFEIDQNFSKNNKDYDLHQIVFPGIGHHPWYLQNIAENWLENLEDKIKELEAKQSNYFIGEIGIDGGRPKK